MKKKDEFPPSLIKAFNDFSSTYFKHKIGITKRIVENLKKSFKDDLDLNKFSIDDIPIYDEDTDD